MSVKFTKKGFESWLSEKSDRSLVGNPESPTDCPLCRFLRDQGAEDINMSISDKNIDGRFSENPLWAINFQRRACDHVDANITRRITAKKALSFL